MPAKMMCWSVLAVCLLCAQTSAFSFQTCGFRMIGISSAIQKFRLGGLQNNCHSIEPLASSRSRATRAPAGVFRMSSTTRLPSVDASQHVVYLRDVASVPHPEDFQPQLELLLRVLAGTRGCSILPPSQRSGVHPLVIPLARDPADGTVIGLLRQPLKPQLDLPVVRAGPKGLDLLAPSVELFIRRAAAEAVLVPTPPSDSSLHPSYPALPSPPPPALTRRRRRRGRTSTAIRRPARSPRRPRRRG